MAGRRAAGALLAIALVGALGASSASASFPGRNGEIVYSWVDWSGRAITGSSGVDAYDPRRKRERRIAGCAWYQGSVPSNCSIGDSATSPDRRSVAMVVSEPSGVDAYAPPAYRLSIVGERAGSFPLPGPAFDLAWSAAGDSLLITLYEGPEAHFRRGPARVAHYALDGRELAPLASDGASDAEWSSQGDIVFVQGGQLWVASAGGGARQITTAGGKAPSWAPDGGRLTFERDGEIWVTRADGTGQSQLTRGSGTSPVWSPDGARIAFVRLLEGEGTSVGSIWAMRSDGCRPHALQVSYGLGGYSSPSWQRRTGKPAQSRPSACARRKAKRRAAERRAAKQRRVAAKGRRGR